MTKFRLSSLSGVLLLLLLLSGCGGKKVAWHGPVADLNNYPQNLQAYIQPDQADKPLIDDAEQIAATQRYKRLFFKPWSQEKSIFPLKEAAWAPKHYAGKSSWTSEGKKVGSEVWQSAADNANIKKFPSLGWKGILIENASLRALPTSTPYYRNPNNPGEGYPFDYMAFSVLWIGTPVFVSHISLDGQWLFCETALLSGWVPTKAVRSVSSEFINLWLSLPLAALAKDRIPLDYVLGGTGGSNTRDLRIGTILPQQGGSVLVPVAQGNAAGWRAIALPPNTIVDFPMPFTAGNVALVGNEMMGEHYGWGGIDYLRDCSAMLRDLFTTFGIWLPRNSSQQLKVGEVSNISGMLPPAKEKRLKDSGKPFRTLVGMPGHVMLYIGQYNDRAVVYHDVWGTRTDLGKDGQGRLIIGKVSVTSLEPGEEHQEVRRAGTLLKRVQTFTVIP